ALARRARQDGPQLLVDHRAVSFWKKRKVRPRPSESDTVGFQSITRAARPGLRQLRRCSPGRAGPCSALTVEPAAPTSEAYSAFTVVSTPVEMFTAPVTSGCWSALRLALATACTEV